MKYLIFFFTVVSFTKCYSQKTPILIKKGIYSGGICLDGAICGDWILKPDSSFVFIEFDKSCIKKAAMGKITAVSDSFITVQFGKMLPVLSNIKIDYFSETKQSFDSIYFYGQLKNTLSEPIPYATIVYGDKRSTLSDSKGNFTGVFPLNEKPMQFEVIKKDDGYSPIKVQLNPNNNYHKLTITIPKVDSNSCILVENFNTENTIYTFRIFNNRLKKSSSLSLTYISDDEKLMINKLLEAKSKQPFLSSSIKALISYINK
jgi:hypothetical protein